MASRVYATAADVQRLVSITPSAGTLRRASRDVDRMLRGAVYEVDENGMPTDPEVVELFVEMVAEQCVWYLELGDETGVAALSGGSIGQVTLPTVRGAGSNPADGLLAPRALDLARSTNKIAWQVRY